MSFFAHLSETRIMQKQASIDRSRHDDIGKTNEEAPEKLEYPSLVSYQLSVHSLQVYNFNLSLTNVVLRNTRITLY